MTVKSISYRISMGGGDQARAELKTIGDAAEAQETRAVKAAEAKARRVAELERQLAAAKAILDKADAKVSTFPGRAGFSGSASAANAASDAAAARAAKELAAALEQQAQRADRLLAAIDPLHAAQVRYNNEMREAQALYKGGALTVDQFTMAQRRSKEALDAATMANNRNGVSVGQQRAAYMNLGFQVQDITQQMALGTPLMTIMAQQAGQTASAIAQGTSGASGGLKGALASTAAFVAGPWGAALTGGALVLAMMAGKSDEAKLSSIGLTDAQKFEEMGTVDLVKAIHEKNDALQSGLRSQEDSIRLSIAAAHASVQAAKGKREEAKADLLRAKASAEYMQFQLKWNPIAMGMSKALGGSDVRLFDQKIKDLESSIGALDTAIAKGNDNILIGGIQLSDIRLREETDKRAASDGRHKRAAAAITDEYRKGNLTLKQREDKMRSINREHEKELSAIKQTNAAGGRKSAVRVESLTDTMGLSLLRAAQGYSGNRENTRAGKATLKTLFSDAGISIDPEMTAWCAAFVNSVLQTQGFQGTGSLAARSFLSYGKATDTPEKGDIVVLKRGNNAAQGHVGFYAGEGKNGSIMVTGGNQNNQVSTASYSRKDVLGYRRVLTGDEAAREVEAESRAIEMLTGQYRALLSTLDPVAAASLDIADQQKRISELVKAGPKKGGITLEEGNRLSLGVSMLGLKNELDLPGAESESSDAQSSFVDYDSKREAKIKASAEAAEQMMADDDARTRMLERQLELVGANDNERRRELLTMETILELERAGIEAESDRGQEIIASRLAVDDLQKAYDRVSAVQEDFRAFGESTLDALFDPANWDDWGNMGKRVLNELMKMMMELALLNPLKNALYGSDLPGLSSLGGVFASLIGGGGGAGAGAAVGQTLGWQIPGNAMGTENWRGGWTEVGENGKELVRLPGGSKIMPAAATRRALANDNSASAAPVVYQTLNVTGAVDLATREEVVKIAKATKDATMMAIRDSQRRRA